MKKFVKGLLLVTIVVIVLLIITAPLSVAMFSLGVDYARGMMTPGTTLGLLFMGTMFSLGLLLVANKIQEISERSQDDE
jgi:hypothetical protein